MEVYSAKNLWSSSENGKARYYCYNSNRWKFDVFFMIKEHCMLEYKWLEFSRSQISHKMDMATEFILESVFSGLGLVSGEDRSKVFKMTAAR